MEQKNQFVTLPNELVENPEVSVKALVVYCAIKKFMNVDTLSCYPSNTTIAELCGCKETTVKGYIRELENAGYIEVERRLGKSNKYTFKPHKNFEPFSYEFLDNKNLKLREKAYLMAQQKNMYINPDSKLGTISYSTSEIAELTKMSESTVLSCEKTLMKQGVLIKIPSLNIDEVSGTKEQIRKFLLEVYNVMAYALKKAEKHDEDIAVLKEQIAKMQKEIDMLTRAIAEQEKSKSIIMD